MKFISKPLAALAVALLIPLAACSSGAAPIRAEQTQPAATVAPVPKVSVGPDGQAAVCERVTPSAFTLPDDLAAAFTKVEVAAAVCEAIRFQIADGWTSLAVPGDTVARSKGQAITETLRPWLTARALDDADTLARRAADGGAKGARAEEGLTALTMVNVTNKTWPLRASVDADALILGDRTWGDSKVALDRTKDAAGRERIVVTIPFTDSVLLSRATDEKPASVSMTRTIEFAMSQTSLKDHPWLVDGWDADWTWAKPALDKTGKS